jgi:hypothetical protein
MKKQFKVPFDKNGNHMTTTQNYPWIVGKEVDNYEFIATLKYQGWEGSRSGIFVIWSEENGKQYRSSMKMLDEILNGSANVTDLSLSDVLTISGTFTFKKQGTAVLLTLKK